MAFEFHRRLTKIGPKTMGASIPADIVEKYGLNHGDEVLITLPGQPAAGANTASGKGSKKK